MAKPSFCWRQLCCRLLLSLKMTSSQSQYSIAGSTALHLAGRSERDDSHDIGKQNIFSLPTFKIRTWGKKVSSCYHIPWIKTQERNSVSKAAATHTRFLPKHSSSRTVRYRQQKKERDEHPQSASKFGWRQITVCICATIPDESVFKFQSYSFSQIT